MRCARIVATAVVTVCAVWAWGETPVSGWFQVEDDRFEPTHAVAVRDVSTGFEPGSKIIHVIMATSPLDTSGADTALDPQGAIRDHIEGDCAVVTVKEDGSLHYVYVYFDDGAKNYGFRGGTAKTESITADKVVARAFTEKEESLGGTPYSFDVSFTSAILPERKPGKELGSGGGAPGKAYAALVKAMHDKDVAVLGRHLEASQAERLAEADEEWRAYMLDDIAGEAPKQIEVVGGELFDGWAILAVEGKNWSDSKVAGEVKMVLDGDSWRFAEEDLSYVW